MAALRIVGWLQDIYDELILGRWFRLVVIVLMGGLALTAVTSVVAEVVRDPDFTPTELSLTLGDLTCPLIWSTGEVSPEPP